MKAADPPTTSEFEALFPAKLHYVLEQVEDDVEGRGVISWQPHGRAFVVRNREKFVKQYLPNWFRQTTWASFQRQLNHYEFKRITSGLDRNAYYHPCFVKGERGLCKHIRRAKVKGTGPRKPSTADEQPNFYESLPSAPFPRIETPRALPLQSDGVNAAAAALATRSLPAPGADCSFPTTIALLGTTFPRATGPGQGQQVGAGRSDGLSLNALLSAPFAAPRRQAAWAALGPTGRRVWATPGPPPAYRELLNMALTASAGALQGGERPRAVSSSEGSSEGSL